MEFILYVSITLGVSILIKGNGKNSYEKINLQPYTYRTSIYQCYSPHMFDQIMFAVHISMYKSDRIAKKNAVKNNDNNITLFLSYIQALMP